ncbi:MULTISPECIES: LysR substrate-binding domain-containing protein [Pseudomonas]|uniref:LysR substrate-binding domain-containing protein n=1 Tax=Pseudomonas TaxID=286 RepID=UPI000D6F230B|nr:MULTISPECIES: LysR substrate-binding domain-containing protein [unclassified Pseudomonas]PWU30373.1 LysR family transcriptional regulator [Pseudomonas sp. RW407]
MHFPSMTALRALDAVARLGSVSAAAGELNLTRSAISHRIATLEERLGFALTERTGRGIRLTERGEHYAREVQRILADVQRAASRFDAEQASGRLCVSCNPGFASYWLCQHIGDFLARYPQVQLHVVSPRTPQDTSAAEADLFIAYGTGDWPSQVVEQIVALHFFPICSPRLLNASGGLKQPAELAGHTLLHMNDFADWRLWLGAVGARDVDFTSGVLFADATCTLAACIAAQGVAIGDNLLSGEALRRGLLVRPFDISIQSNRGYYLVTDALKAERPVVRAFSQWLKARVAATIRQAGDLEQAPLAYPER